MRFTKHIVEISSNLLNLWDHNASILMLRKSIENNFKYLSEFSQKYVNVRPVF